MTCVTVKCFAKSFLISLNTLFVILGSGIVILAIILLTGENMVGGYLGPLFSAIPGRSGVTIGSVFTTIVIIALSAGLFVIIVAIFGCCAGVGKNRWAVIVYGVIMIVILLLELTAIIICYTMTSEVDQQIKNTMKDTITNNYEGSTGTNEISNAWNYAFVTFDCCGVDNYTDLYSATNWNRSTNVIPVTCCNVTGGYPDYQSPTDPTCVTNPTDTNSYYNTGCYTAIKQEIEKYNGIFIGVGAGIMVLELMAIISAFIVLRSLQKINPKKST